MKREKKEFNDVHHIKQKRRTCLPLPNAAHKPAFRPNGLNAVIKAAFREGCVYPRRERVMIT